MEKSPESPDEIPQPVHGAAIVDDSSLKHDAHAQDLGAGLFHEVQGYSLEELEAESAKVRRLIDWHIMPIVGRRLIGRERVLTVNQICITYTIQFLDKLSLNYASAYSLKEDLGLTG